MKEIEQPSDNKIDTNIELYTYCMTSQPNCGLPHMDLIKGLDVKDLDKNLTFVKYLQHRNIVERLQAIIKELENRLTITAECVKEIVEKDLRCLQHEILSSGVVGQGEQYKKVSDLVTDYLNRYTKHYFSSKEVINEIKAQGIEEAISNASMTYQLDYTPSDMVRTVNKALRAYAKKLRTNHD